MTKSVQRLTKSFLPRIYTLCIDLTKRKAREFSGTVTIEGKQLKESSILTLHSKELEIMRASIDNQQVATTAGDDDELHLHYPHLAAGEHTVVLAFKGKITDAMHGLYPCYFTENGTAKELLVTQLESHYAREVFPCIDEPAGKAVFHLTLKTEQGITVLGNTGPSTQIEQDGRLITTFAPTPRMSPYLLAFVAGKLQYTEMHNRHGVRIRAYATPDKVEQTRFAVDFAAKALDYLDDYFTVPYPLTKCDIVAVPDFAAGAMENWGLVTYRETAMLVDPQNTATDTKQYVAIVIAHELSHQWFGNLVTMEWWDDLWLNESFANFMEHVVVDHFFPEWQTWEQYNGNEQQYALSRDGLASVQAVKQPVRHPDELQSLFDSAIVYAKGSCLMRMLHDYLGADTFCDGLRAYMQAFAYQNTQAADLWRALSNVSGKDVATFMNPWLKQPGHPVVTIMPEGDKVKLTQQRFFANPQQSGGQKTDLWPVPLLSNQLAETTLMTREAVLGVKYGMQLLLNQGYVGFYHTKYSKDQLQQLAALASEQKLPAANRLGLLADNLALTKAGFSQTSDLMELLAAYSHEPAYPVWQNVLAIIDALRTLVNEDKDIKPYLQNYVKKLVKTQSDRLGWQPIQGEPYFDQLLRPDIMSLMAYAEVPEMIQYLLTLFDSAQKPEDITYTDVRSIVYTVAVRKRGKPAISQLLAWYKRTSSSDERLNLALGITAARNPALAEEVTELFMTKLIKPQDFMYWFVYLLRNPYGKLAGWSWMTGHWDWIREHFKGDHDYPDFPKNAASCFSTEDDLIAYKKFFEPKLEERDLARTIRQGVEDIEMRALWRKRDLKAIRLFLEQNYKAENNEHSTWLKE